MFKDILNPFFFFIISLSYSLMSFSQSIKNDTLTIPKRDTQYFIKKSISCFLDSTRTLSFDQVKQLNFIQTKQPLYDPQSKMWYKFYIKPQVHNKYLILSSGYLDLTEIFVPQQNAYKKFTVGRHTKKEIEFTILDKSYVYLEVDSVDFSQPFYFNKVTLSRSGKYKAYKVGSAALTNDIQHWKNLKEKQLGYVQTNHIFFAIFGLALFMFFINYLVTKDINFLNYSGYLFFTILIFNVDIPFLSNTFSKLHPRLFDAVENASIIFTSVCYFNFVIVFINVKQRFTQLHKITRVALIIATLIGVFCFFQSLMWPFFKYRFELVFNFDIVFLVVSVAVFIYLSFQKLSLTHKIVLLGSFLLIVGQLLSVMTRNAYFFLFSVVLEIIAFASVVSYQNKLTSSHNIKTQASLKEEALKRKNLQEIDKIKSRFITNITHEFKTPLTIIEGYTNNLTEKLEHNKNNTASLQQIKQSTNTLMSLVNQMLQLDALQGDKLAVKNSYGNLVNSTKTTLKSFKKIASEKNIALILNTEPNEIFAKYDAEKYRQILSNLVSNAIKFSAENSKIHVNLNAEGNQQIKLEVKDFGVGISEAHLPLIFDRFYQVETPTQKIYNGTGIGLSLVKELVELMGGTIAVHSKINSGTTFTIKLPLQIVSNNNITDEKETSNVKANTLPQTFNSIADNKEKTTILIVEDNRDMAKYIASCLDKTYNILFAKDGREGLEIANKDIPDIIITDVMMPFMDGFELTEQLQNNTNTNHIPIIMLTAMAMQENKLEGIKSGADVYLTKPFQKKELLLRIEKLILKRKQLQVHYGVQTFLKPTSLTKNLKDKNLVFLNKVVDAIHQHLENAEFGSKELAGYIAMSDSQLYRKLKAITNTSTAIFIRNIRLEKGKEMLLSTNLSISEIAYAVGFNDPKWFSKAYKENFGKSPSEDRNS